MITTHICEICGFQSDNIMLVEACESRKNSPMPQVLRLSADNEYAWMGDLWKGAVPRNIEFFQKATERTVISPFERIPCGALSKGAIIWRHDLYDGWVQCAFTGIDIKKHLTLVCHDRTVRVGDDEFAESNFFFMDVLQ